VPGVEPTASPGGPRIDGPPSVAPSPSVSPLLGPIVEPANGRSVVPPVTKPEIGPNIGVAPAVGPIIVPWVCPSYDLVWIAPSLGTSPSVAPPVPLSAMRLASGPSVPAFATSAGTSVVILTGLQFPPINPRVELTPDAPPVLLSAEEWKPVKVTSQKDALRRLISRSTQHFNSSNTWAEFVGKCKDPRGDLHSNVQHLPHRAAHLLNRL
jgi:hypothetical protein